MNRPKSMPVPTTATMAPAKAMKTAIDIPPYRA
jgi:hypothetical protein